jgi:hypothetical protein
MWLLTVPAEYGRRNGGCGRQTGGGMSLRVRGLAGAYLSITSSLTLYGDGQGTPQTIVAKFVPSRELFSVEFMLKEFLPRGRGVGSWIMQQMVLWTRSLPPETLVGRLTSRPWMRKHSQSDPPEQTVARAGVPVPAGETSSMPLRADELQLPRGRCSTLRVEPWYPRYAGWKTVIAGCRKNRAARRQKTVAKTVNYFT